jgi:hypothetical protein
VAAGAAGVELRALRFGAASGAVIEAGPPGPPILGGARRAGRGTSRSPYHPARRKRASRCAAPRRGRRLPCRWWWWIAAASGRRSWAAGRAPGSGSAPRPYPHRRRSTA